MGHYSETQPRRPLTIRDFDNIIHLMWPARPFLRVPIVCDAFDLLLPYQMVDERKAPTCLWCAIREEPA